MSKSFKFKKNSRKRIFLLTRIFHSCNIFTNQNIYSIKRRKIMDKDILRNAAILHPKKIMYPYDEIIGLEGFDAICAFSEIFGGTTIYVPYVRKIFAECLVEEAAKEYNGYNLTDLSKKYGFSVRGLKKGFEYR